VTNLRPLPHRHGRVLVDWLPNDPLNSLVAPYSLRAMPWPTVAAPVAWAEVEEALRARRAELLTFLPETVLERNKEGLPAEWEGAP
jgi:bifunctional non-homologous end joining protein LigD